MTHGHLSTPQDRRPIFAYSRRDAILVALTAVQLGLIAWGVINFSELSLAGRVLFFPACVFLAVTHHEVIIHYFTHTPFFSSKLLNSLYSAVGSITVMEPVTLFGISHLEHHRYGNDAKDPVSGTTRDYTSTYQFGEAGNHEALWRYALLSPLREMTDIRDSYRSALASRARRQVGFETAVLVAFWGAIVSIDWRFSLCYVLVVYAGQVGACTQNYFEHYGATPGNRMANSVSCYAPVYNFIWFNNGYHQEHHYRPAVHWTKVRALRKEMLPEDQRRVVRLGHIANLPWLARRKAAENRDRAR